MDPRPPDAMDPQPPDPTSSAPDDRRFGDASATASKWLAELQAIIDNLATQSAPVVREVGAKAAEVAAIAAERAGPLAQRAADVTQDVGARLATRSRDLAAELRRAAASEAPASGPGSWNDSASHPASPPANDADPTDGASPSA
jgi:hypothetical protein